MSRAGAACLIALLLAGCDTVQHAGPSFAPSPPPPSPPPPRMELGAIDGVGAFRTADGGHASCAGQSVALMADNARSHARMIALYGAADHAMARISRVQARAAKLGPSADNSVVNSMQCGPDGRFAFGGLQAGSYFVIARVRLERPQAAPADYAILQQVQLRLGETQQVRLGP